MKGTCKGRLVAVALVTLGLMVAPVLSWAQAPSPGAVQPTGELRIALAFLGGQRFIPWTGIRVWRHQAIHDAYPRLSGRVY